MKTYRDLTFINLNKDEYLVISCDSCAGVGNKELDVVKASLDIVSYFTTRVCMMEIMSVKAKPIVVVDNIGVSMKSGGYEIIDGIKKFLTDNNLDIPINGSTEENFKVAQTFLGLTVIGTLKKEYIKNNKVKNNDLVVLLGLPKVGSEININEDNDIISFYDFKKILDLNYISNIIPVGSKGIGYECRTIEKITNMKIDYFNTNIDFKKSSGPATSVIITMKEDYLDNLRKIVSCPINILGKIFSKTKPL
ncbi:hypothetical protein [Tepidibacter formicigenes]|uniref:Alpha-ribazole kinase n=1 Tax=Tepidibacter formicigenes DSM 15518 TaxID=1123349 RepID=A0A1M6TDP4_9FIRM|nr:hypothetical protein [Tepidibacter formicigenes]SHK55009.1 alpha-ribazole kinase [Tepidibacter formicigenes DSM 15518]